MYDLQSPPATNVALTCHMLRPIRHKHSTDLPHAGSCRPMVSAYVSQSTLQMLHLCKVGPANATYLTHWHSYTYNRRVRCAGSFGTSGAYRCAATLSPYTSHKPPCPQAPRPPLAPTLSAFLPAKASRKNSKHPGLNSKHSRNFWKHSRVALLTGKEKGVTAASAL